MRPIGPRIADAQRRARRAPPWRGGAVGEVGAVALARVDHQHARGARRSRAAARQGPTAAASSETSLPSASPKPPGSRKSRCMSMMTSAVRAGSIAMAEGSAGMGRHARPRGRSGGGAASAMPPVRAPHHAGAMRHLPNKSAPAAPGRRGSGRSVARRRRPRQPVVDRRAQPVLRHRHDGDAAPARAARPPHPASAARRTAAPPPRAGRRASDSFHTAPAPGSGGPKASSASSAATLASRPAAPAAPGA